MAAFEAELATARELSVDRLADAIEAIGFACTRCGACCQGDPDDAHTATVFPDEIRALGAAADRDWRDVARPMPFGLDDSGTGETLEWALQTDACGDCVFYADGGAEQPGTCTAYADRPLICATYPFSLDLGGSTPMGVVVEAVGRLRAHECEGLGGDIDRADAVTLAATLKRRTIRELEEGIAVRDGYARADADGTVVHDSEGAKRPDGTPIDR